MIYGVCSVAGFADKIFLGRSTNESVLERNENNGNADAFEQNAIILKDYTFTKIKYAKVQYTAYDLIISSNQANNLFDSCCFARHFYQLHFDIVYSHMIFRIELRNCKEYLE